MKYYSLIICLSTLTCLWACNDSSEPQTGVRATSPATPNSHPQKKQLIRVITPDWSSPYGNLSRFEDLGQGWIQVGNPIPVQVGKKGMGWGIGTQDFRGEEGPIKREGDLKSPAGIFSLGTAFGYEARYTGLKWPYHPISQMTMCIEDGTSHYYNQIIEEGSVNPDWNSTDRMQRKDDLYRYGVFVNHNTQAEENSGSCIFLHVWRPGGSGTAGCTSMSIPNIQTLIQWLDPEAVTRMIQMPQSAYDAYKQDVRKDLP